MKKPIVLLLLLGLCPAAFADIQDPPSNDYGPTRKLGRGISNFFLAPAEIPVTIATVNKEEGNAAAAGYGVVRGVGRAAARHIAGFQTVPQLAEKLAVSVHWIYDRIHNGTIALSREARTKLYLFPDKPATLAALRKLKAGKLKLLTFDKKVGS